MTKAFNWLVETAGSVTGRNFKMVIGSSSVATAAIIASAMAGSGSLDLAAALLAQGFGGPEQPAATSTGPTAPVPATAAAPAPAPTPAAGPVAAPTAPAAAIPKTPEVEPEPFDRQPGRVNHVFMISLTSPGYEKSFGTTSEMPYLSQTLRPQGQLLSNYSLISAKGLPNYIAMTSGQRPNGQTSLDCPSYNLFAPTAGPNKKGFVAGDGCLYPLTMTSFPDQLLPERLKWRAYMEDMANPDSPDPATAQTPPKVPTCVRPTVNQPDTTQRSRQGNGYAVRHNPFVYYRSLVDLGQCVPNVLALDKLEPDLVDFNATPSYSFIQPNLCNSGAENPCFDQSAGGAARADDWLEQWIPKIQNTQAFKQGGLIVVTFNETSLPTPLANERVGTLLINRWLPPGSEDARAHNPYSMLKTMEDLFGLDYLAAAQLKSTTAFSKTLLGNGKSIAVGDN